MSRAIVIGAGVTGLAVAGLLAKAGHTVTVLEARDEIGGRAGTWSRQGFRFDTGPSWYLMPEVYDHYFRLMGSSADAELDLVPLAPAYRVISEGTEAIDVVTGREHAVALFESIEPGAGAKLNTYLDQAADAYRLSVDRFLYDSYDTLQAIRHPAVLKRLPLLTGMLTQSLHKKVASEFQDLRLQQILEYPAVFLGGSPFEVPSLYRLMSHLDLDDGVLYPRGGMIEVVRAIERLAARAGAEIRTGVRVERIVRAGGRAVGVQYDDSHFEPADIVVSTADLHHTEEVLLESEPQKGRDRVPSCGAVLLMLGVRGKLDLPHHTLLFTKAWRENFDAIVGDNQTVPNPASLYICHPSATDDSVAPPDHSNLFVLVPAPADPSSGRGGIDGAGDVRIEAIADEVIAQIADWCGIEDLADRIVVRRTVAPEDFATDLGTWRGNALGMAHTLRQSALFRAKNTVKGTSGLYLAGSDVLPGVGVPMCLISAEIVASLVAGNKAPGRLSEPARTP